MLTRSKRPREACRGEPEKLQLDYLDLYRALARTGYRH